MSDTLRTVLWVTGVAFGIAAPGVYVQAAGGDGAYEPAPWVRTQDADCDALRSP